MAAERDIQVMLRLQSTLAAQIKQEEDKVKASMQGMSASAVNWKDVLTKAAGIAAAAFAALKMADLVKHFLKLGEEIEHTSARLGMSTDDFQKWRTVAKLSGAEVETLGRGFRDLAVKAEMNDPIFKKLGITTKDHNGNLRDTSDIMQDVIGRLTEIQNPTERLAVAQKLLGRAAGDAMKIAAQGAYKFREMAMQADSFKLSKEQIKSLADTHIEIEKIGMAFEKAGADILTNFMPNIQSAAKFLIDLAAGVGAFFGNTALKNMEKVHQMEKLNFEIDHTKKKIQDLKNQPFDFGAPGFKMINPALISAEEKLTGLKQKVKDLIGIKVPTAAAGGGGVDLTKENKKQAEEIIKINEEAREIIAQQNMSDDERELDTLKTKYSKAFQIVWRAGKETSGIVKAYEVERTEIVQKQSIKRYDEERRVTLETQKLAIASYNKRLDANKKFQTAMLKGTKAGFIPIAMEYQKDKDEYNQLLFDKQVSQEQYDMLITKLQTDTYASYAEVALGSLSSIAEATKANAQVKKRIAEGEAIISAGKAALGVIENTGQFISNFGPIAGPILEGVELAGIIALAATQISKIESAKMRYGGIAVGGRPGEDSVSTMLEPGEIAYNPSHPNPVLASMIASTVNNTGSTHIHMGGAVVIQGSPSRSDLAGIQEHIDKGITKALRRAQVLGKVTAPGLIIRS